GETEPRQVDVRVIAATNRDLEADMQAGHFREDLFYRLNVFPIHLPPLRDRRSDVPLLAHHFLGKTRQEKTDVTLTSEAVDALGRYDWPGNLRELENEIERALVLTPNGDPIGVDVLSDKLRQGMQTSWRKDGALRDAIEVVERDMVQAALERCKGNKTRMAKQLGITRWTLLQKLKAYEIDR
ncbi:MAG: sigma 54-interacting transcriptional regulator, partial [Candidatus Latescibacteria bacterium]|nr:sigma 54-interacting transcriptional regulator [Candidatus Latescibacterota bacterium]